MVSAEHHALGSEQLQNRLYPRLNLLERPRHAENTFDARNRDTDVFALAYVRKGLSPAPEFRLICPCRPPHEYNREPDLRIEPDCCEQVGAREPQ